MRETRKLKRKQTYTFLGVYDRNTNQFVGRLVDMTKEGVKLRSMAAMETNAVFQFRLDLPFDINGSKEIVFNARSIWCNKCSDSGQYNIGFQVQDVPQTEVARIDLLLQGSLFEDADERIHVTLSKIIK